MKAGHRRTHAKQAPEDQQRFSVPTNYQPDFRSSYDVEQSSRLFYRASDMSYLHNVTPASLVSLPATQPNFQKTKAPKLMQTFQELQKKLSIAKKQLNISNHERPHHRKESSF